MMFEITYIPINFIHLFCYFIVNVNSYLRMLVNRNILNLGNLKIYNSIELTVENDFKWQFDVE